MIYKYLVRIRILKNKWNHVIKLLMVKIGGCLFKKLTLQGVSGRRVAYSFLVSQFPQKI